MKHNTQLNPFIILLCIGVAFALAYAFSYSNLRLWFSPISIDSLDQGPIAPFPAPIPTPRQPQPTIALTDESPGSYHKRGMVYLQRGEYERAIADFTQALTLSP